MTRQATAAFFVVAMFTLSSGTSAQPSAAASPLCSALDQSAFAGIGIQLPAVKPTAQSRRTQPGELGLAQPVATTGCTVSDPKDVLRGLSLTVFEASDRAGLVALVKELHATDPSDPKPVEELTFKDGHCILDRSSPVDAGKPSVAPTHWIQFCSAVKGNRVIQLGYSDPSRARLARLTDFKRLFDAISARN